jgi:hypothetical protein
MEKVGYGPSPSANPFKHNVLGRAEYPEKPSIPGAFRPKLLSPRHADWALMDSLTETSKLISDAKATRAGFRLA